MARAQAGRRYLAALIATAVLAGCAASTQRMELLPRGGALSARGAVDLTAKVVTVETADGRRYAGDLVYKAGPANDATAILRGDGGQMRCDLSWSDFFANGTGTCTNSQGATYDVNVRN